MKFNDDILDNPALVDHIFTEAFFLQVEITKSVFVNDNKLDISTFELFYVFKSYEWINPLWWIFAGIELIEWLKVTFHVSKPSMNKSPLNYD